MRFPTYNNRGVAKAIVYVGQIHVCRAGRVAPLPACRRNGEALSFPMHESILSFGGKCKRFSQNLCDKFIVISHWSMLFIKKLTSYDLLYFFLSLSYRENLDIGVEICYLMGS